MPDQLIVCANCGFSRDEQKRADVTGGEHLFQTLQLLAAQWPRHPEFTILTTGCLCICERACAIAYVGTGKPTYLFADLDPTACAADLLSAAELYLDCKDGMVPAFRLPPALQPCRFARIPAAP